LVARLLTPKAAAQELLRRVERQRAKQSASGKTSAEPQFVISLRPGVSPALIGTEITSQEWVNWLAAWQQVTLPAGCVLKQKTITIRRVSYQAPKQLEIATTAAALGFIEQLTHHKSTVQQLRERFADSQQVIKRLAELGSAATTGQVNAILGLSSTNRKILFDVLAFLAEHPDVSHYSARQLPVLGMHSKWIENHAGLLTALTGQRIEERLLQRPIVVHFTYLDPEYLGLTENGRLAGPSRAVRRHDSWTSVDHHEPEYSPRNVLIVENRDSRLWFPPVPDTIVIEGGGTAAVATLPTIPWLCSADRIVYWGDIDADGLRILALLRREFAVLGITVESILMDDVAFAKYAEFGVAIDADGRQLHAPNWKTDAVSAYLAPTEQGAFAQVITGGPAEIRRIEQERIPLADAAAALRALLASPPMTNGSSGE